MLKVQPSVVGIIGVGLLGSAIAERLDGAKYEVFAWDINPANLSAFPFNRKPEATAIAEHCDRIILSLPNSTAVESVIEEIEHALRPKTIVMDTTTGTPAVVETIAARLNEKEVAFLDACVGGSSQDVRQHRAVILCGGTTAAFDTCRPIFNAIANQTFHLGAPGTGTRMKLAFNLVLGLNRAVLAEGLEFARRSGIQPEAALEVLKHGAAYSRVMDAKGMKMINEDFAPQARLRQHLKDVRQILEEGANVGAPLPLSTVHTKILEEIEAAGFGADDNSAVIRWFKGFS